IQQRLHGYPAHPIYSYSGSFNFKIMKNYWLHSGFYTFLQRFSTLIFGFGGFYLLIRMQSKQEFGVWALVVTITALLEVARNGLIQNGMIKFTIGAKEDEQPAIQSAALFLNVVLTLFSCVFLIVSGPFFGKLWNSPGISDILNIYCLTAISLIPFQQFSYLQQAKFDFKSLSIMYMIRQGSFFGVILIHYIMFKHISVESLAWWLFFSSVISSIAGYFMVKKYFYFNMNPSKFWVKKLFHYGKYSFGTNVSGMIFNGIDQMALGALTSTADVAIYNACAKVNNLIEVPISTVSSIVFPQTSLKASENNDQAIKSLYEKSVAALLALILPFVVIALIFPALFLHIIAGEAYTSYTQVLSIILVFSFLQPFNRQFGTVMDSIGKPKVNFWVITASAGLNLVLNFTLIPMFGIYGAGLATCISLVLAVTFNLWMLNKLLGVTVKNIVLEMGSVYAQCWNFCLKKVQLCF
ncbi:MAG: flippase, partial [Cytophagales bacterium]|nr:flippase [Cytophagales bacterium]